VAREPQEAASRDMQTSQKTTLSSAVARNKLRVIVRVVLLYAVFAALWILFSDRVVETLLQDSVELAMANTLKGLLFVSATSLLLFYFLRRFAALGYSDDEASGKTGISSVQASGKRGPLYFSIFLLAVVFVSLGTIGIRHSRDSYREAAGKQLQSIAELKVRQIEDWLGERYSDARMTGTSPLFSRLLAEWRRDGDPDTREHLLARLEDYRAAYRYRDVLVCDAQGNILLRAGPASHHGVMNTLRESVTRALASGKPSMTGLFLMQDPPPEHVHLDFVAPLAPSAEKKTADAAIVLRTDVESTIYSLLQTWPVPSRSAETILFRQEGDTVHYLNELRHRKDTALKLRLPLSNAKLLASQALAPDYPPGDLLEGVDYRGKPVIGTAKPIAGTNWWLLAKIDRDEVFSPEHRDVLWIISVSLLAWLVSTTLAVLLLQRRELFHSQRKQHEQASQLDALKLLSEIAYGSADAIFAKDRQGRYLLYNRAACAYVGKTEEQIIGQDDTAIYPAEQAARVRAHDMRVMDENRVMSMEDTFDTLAGTRTFLAVKGPLHDEAGNVIGMYGIARDITERKANEENLRRNNEELQRFNHAMIGREMEMIRLKREVNRLAAALNQSPPYELSAMDDASAAPGGEQA
jgi:PAS domain S-box-containing protein